MLGDELRKVRLAADLSQEQVAIKAKITREYVSIVERGKRSPTVDVLLRICKGIGVSAADVLRRVEKQRK